MINNKKLIVNSDKGNLLNELIKSIQECKRFYFSVAFINFSGLQLLLEAFKEAENKGVKGQIITSTYLNFTEAKALKRINDFNNIHLKIFKTDKEVGFHSKAYIFEYEDFYKVIIGSSNVTQSALKSNVEWNVEMIIKDDKPFIDSVLNEYQYLWERSIEADDEFIAQYEEFLNTITGYAKKQMFLYERSEYITPKISAS